MCDKANSKKEVGIFNFLYLKRASTLFRCHGTAVHLLCFECDVYLKSASLFVQGTNNEAEQSDP